MILHGKPFTVRPPLKIRRQLQRDLMNDTAFTTGMIQDDEISLALQCRCYEFEFKLLMYAHVKIRAA